MSPIQWMLLALAAVAALAVAFYWLVSRLERGRYRHFAPDDGTVLPPSVAPPAEAELVVTSLPSGVPRSLPPSTLNWVGRGCRVTVQSFALADPMTWFWSGPAPRGRVGDQEPSAIQVKLPATAGPVALPDEPRYARLSPAQRGTYLAWLASGRSSQVPGAGHLLLFYYGMERRALADGSDAAEVFDDLLALRALASDAESAGRRFERASRELLWFLAVRHARWIPLESVREHTRAGGVRDEDDLAALVVCFAQAGTPLPDWAAFAAAGRLVWSRRSNVAERVAEQFEALFVRRCRERFGGGGFVLQPAKREGRFEYRPLNPSLDAAEFRAPSPWNQPAQFKPLSELWNECVDELKPFARAKGRRGDEADLTLEAWEALPDEIRAAAEHPLSDDFARLVERNTDAAGRTVVCAGDLARLVGIGTDTKLSASQARRVCEVAGDVGYCVEPDARLTGKGWRADEKLAVFLCIDDRPADARRYAEASALLRFGIAVAAADGSVHDAEVAAVNRHIAATFDLNDEEKRRLDALRDRLVASPPAKVAVDKALRGLPEAARRATVEMILVMVAVDGPATDDDRRKVQQWSAALGFSKDEVEGFLRSLPEPAAPAVRDENEQAVRLDHAAIAAILKDTAEVAQMLSAAMKSDEDEEEAETAPPPPAAAPAVGTADPTLPRRFAALYQELIARGEWPVDEAEALARRHGHMLSGAVEALNDWSCEKHGTQLFVEEADRLVVENRPLG